MCYILNGNQYCLKGGDDGASYETNKTTLLTSFGEDNCSVGSDYVTCSASGLRAYARDDGRVQAYAGLEGCGVYDNGSAHCA